MHISALKMCLKVARLYSHRKNRLQISAKLISKFQWIYGDREKIDIAFFCVFCNGASPVKAASASADPVGCITAIFSPDKARRRGVGLTARAGLEVGVNCRQ
ncbi:hypothetical protein KO537_19365 [Shewanella sp. NKUCC01_JLK]|uniref:hypothetical protein n=1 Tax=Shewanella sp. NKUCC01_JLK TaxID=2842123 RepID=UPI001C5AC5C7|nr:hypothetical protein [Shewanella sp. NKUCC01_JLK]MBW3516849.1 hypothetical protein [Shewanella sp. NKUCC01_JLK]